MSEKKKGMFSKLFKANSNSCACGVTIVEEKKDEKVSYEKKDTTSKK